MKRLVIFSAFLAFFVCDAYSATPAQRRGGAVSAPAATTTSAQPAAAARAATVRTTAARGAAPSAGASNGVAARAATTTAARGAAPKAAATTSNATAQKNTAISARAASTQKVIGTGTKVASAAANVVVNAECQQKYNGCMDAFCMLDNTTGGRCICSNRNAELNAVLAEIEKLDQQSYQMATVGVERIEMGADADAAMAAANAAAQSVLKSDADTGKDKQRKSLDLSLWSADTTFAEQSMFGSSSDSIDNKEGDELHSAASALCTAQIPECAADIKMLQMIYSQQIRSDCTAYENSLKQQKTASTQKLAAAEQALREAALEQYRSANKYDLGKCTVEFRKCMASTGGCKDDFTGCVGLAAAENATRTSDNKSVKASQYTIKGTLSQITIATSTYDTLLSKKPLCESVTKSCTNVADQVWDTFLREIAPTMKSAELLAESNLRTSCIANISDCFQKACKDTMDPNDPDGSYDMCLSRPETVKSLCKVQIDPCIAAEPLILDFVYARLAAIRVDACTNEVKHCLQADDRCGPDYANCIGLDFDSIKKMCPIEKLVGCQKDGSLSSMSELDELLQGIYLNIDNALLDECQNAVSQKMLEICGDTISCPAFAEDKFAGTESLVTYANSNGDTVISGLISFGNIVIKDAESTAEDRKFSPYEIDINNYSKHLNSTDQATMRVVNSLQSLASKISQKISLLTTDPKIQMCIEGRDMSQATGGTRTRSARQSAEEAVTQARFPHLIDSAMMAIINSAVDQARKNYNSKYDSMVSQAMKAKDDAIKASLCAALASSDEPVCTDYKTLEGSRNKLTGALQQSEYVCTNYEPASDKYSKLFSDSQPGLLNPSEYVTEYVISGAKLSDLARVQQSGHSEYIQTMDNGAMIGRISMAAVYSSGTGQCTLTTTSTTCKDMEKLIVADTYTHTCGGGGIQVLGGEGCGGGGVVSIGGKSETTTVRKEEFHGSVCTDFSAPQTITQIIEM